MYHITLVDKLDPKLLTTKQAAHRASTTVFKVGYAARMGALRSYAEARPGEPVGPGMSSVVRCRYYSNADIQNWVAAGRPASPPKPAPGPAQLPLPPAVTGASYEARLTQAMDTLVLMQGEMRDRLDSIDAKVEALAKQWT